jgi:hypothetical protein
MARWLERGDFGRAEVVIGGSWEIGKMRWAG